MTLNGVKRMLQRISSAPRAYKIAAAALAIVIVFAIAVPALLMPEPGVIGALDQYVDNYESLQISMHAGMACGQCHRDTRGALSRTVGNAVDFYRTFFSRDAELAYMRFERPPAAACMECHREDWSHDAESTTRIPHPAHLRVSEETRECAECHRWTAHQEQYLDEHREMEFSGVCAAYGCHSGVARSDECSDCHHTLLENPREWRTAHAPVVLNRGAGRCVELCHQIDQCQQCHTTGTTPFRGLPTPTERDIIEQEHAEPAWTRTHGVRALEDQAMCLTCHVSIGPCQNCHAIRPDSHGPEETWIAAHQDAVRHERQCVTCHEQSFCDDCHEQFREMW